MSEPEVTQPGIEPGIEPGNEPGNEPGRHDAVPGDSPTAPRRQRPRQTPARAFLGAVTEVVVVLAMALVLSLLIKTFLVQAFFIPSTSMEDTLLTGDRVLVSKLNPRPLALHRGDVVVFKDPGGWLPLTSQPAESGPQKLLRETLTFVGLYPQDSGEHLIKRVIGLPGDTVVCCDAQGRVSVNGVPLDESYLFPGDEPSVKSFSVVVPAGKLWVMGDHRSVSFDSRFHPDLDGGFVPQSSVVGRAFVIVWPFGRAAGLAAPDSVFAKVPEPAS
jgi:signal peptidase I